MHPVLTYLLLALLVLVVVFGTWLSGKKATARWPRFARAALVFQILPFVGAYLLLRPGSGMTDESEVQAALDQGQPVLLDFYSNT